MINLVKESVGCGGNLGYIRGDIIKKKGVGNSSIEKLGDKIYVTYRVCDYTFISFRYNNRDKKSCWYPNITEFPDSKFGSENVIGILNKDTLSVENQTQFLKNPDKGKFLYSGYEDVRLINWGGKLHASCSKPNAVQGMSNIPMMIIGLNENFGSEFEINCKIADVEKNWMPVEGQPMTYLYSTGSPLCVIKISEKEATLVKRDDNIKFETFYKGSTQARLYKDHYVVMVHYNETSNDENGMLCYKYFHKFLVYDKDWNFVRESEPFAFMDYTVEFSCGFLIDGGFVYTTFSIFDNVSFVLKTPIAYFDWLVGFGKKPKNVDFKGNAINMLGRYQTDELFMEFCETLVEEENCNGAFSLYTKLGAYSTNVDIARDAYTRAACLVNDCSVGVDCNRIVELIEIEHIVKQINILNKEII